MHQFRLTVQSFLRPCNNQDATLLQSTPPDVTCRRPSAKKKNNQLTSQRQSPQSVSPKIFSSQLTRRTSGLFLSTSVVCFFVSMTFNRMIYTTTLFLLPFAMISEGAPAGHSWNYKNTENWSTSYKDCKGNFQSPIKLDPETAILKNYEKISFNSYDQVAAESITNNGHTVVLHIHPLIRGRDLPYLSGGGLPGDKFKFAQLHFHWGGNSSRGSEHIIGSTKYVGELHMVHFNAKYGTLDKAIEHKDGLAVLGILIETQKRDNVAFRHFVTQFPQVLEEGYKTTLSSPIPLIDLLPDNTDNFYRYNGSLTTPACQEIVAWTVFDTPIAVSERQLARFRELLDREGHLLGDNFRPLNLKHGRIIYYRSENGLPLQQSSSEQSAMGTNEEPQPQKRENTHPSRIENRKPLEMNKELNYGVKIGYIEESL